MRTSKESEQDEIAEYWRDAVRLTPLPKYFYVAVKGFSIRSMSLKRVTCVGEASFHSRRGPVWIGTDVEFIWSGPEFSGPRLDTSRRYAYTKSYCDVLLEDAIARLTVFASEYEAYYEGYMAQLADRAEEIRRQREDTVDRLEEARSFWLSAKDVK